MASLMSRWRLSTAQTGAIFAIVCLAVGALLFMKTSISAKIRPGDTVTVNFSRDYKIRPDVTKVKVAGVPVGLVSSVEPSEDGRGAVVKLKVDHGIKEVLGSAPSAAIRPTTILGGNYYVELVPGGDRGVASAAAIPVARTTVPVELDSAVEMVTGKARSAIRGDVKSLHSTFTGPATPALRDFARTSPEALESSGRLLAAVSGTRPSKDLTNAITGLESVSRQLTRDPAHLSDSLSGLATLSGTLDRQKVAISTTVANAPRSLRHARTGLSELSTVLDQTATVGRSARPAARSLTQLLDEGTKDIDTIRPVVADLRPLMNDLAPTVRTLVPTAKNLSGVVDDVSSPVIDRVSGPFLATLNRPVAGKGSPLGYQQVAYFFTTLNVNSMTTDSNGAMINFQPGPGPDTVTQFSPARLMQTWNHLLSILPGGKR